MKFSESWLRSFCNPPQSSEELAHLLTMAGLEVEEKKSIAPAFSGVVVAEIKEIAVHPGADRLRVCRVDTGKGALQQIVCGAPNAAAGLKVPCALVGSALPNGLTIQLTQLRGIESSGMLCSAKELGISDDASGLLLLPQDAPIGMNLRDYLQLDEQLITLKLTPNRSDCLGIAGLAREVAALTGAPLHEIPIPSAAVAISDRISVKISAADLCGRFSGRVIRGVDAQAKTPEWMKARLEHCGQRSISVLVDISNYVMLELNRPNHIFDLAKVQQPLEVRWSQRGETLTLLNGSTIELDAQTGVIADAQGVESLAGIMGGEATAVSDTTKDIYVESAFWFPEAIAGRSQRYGFSSEAGHRFERGVDYADTITGLERVSELVLQICGGRAGPIDDQTIRLPTRDPIRIRTSRVNSVIGIALSPEQVAAIFNRQKFDFIQEGADFIVTPPSWRFDLIIEEDLIEEIARIYGYENIPASVPQGVLTMLPAAESSRTMARLRDILVDRGMQEVINYAFVEEAWEKDFAANTDPVRLANPIANQMSVMRSTLIGGLMATLLTNLRRRENRVRIFEIGRCFTYDTGTNPVEGFAQPQRLAILLYGSALPEQWGNATRAVDFFDGKGIIESLLQPQELGFERCNHPALHPGRCARVIWNDRKIGVLGELHPQLAQKYELMSSPVVVELDLEPLLSMRLPEFKPVSKFPAVVRDIAVLVAAEIPVQKILDILKKNASPSVTAIQLFDHYIGKGIAEREKSLAFRVVMQDTQRTLLDAEVDEVMVRLVAVLAQHFDARLRN